MLAVQNITKAYGIHPILNGVTFTLNDGQRVGLVGANGVGKSTLLKIIVGQIEADAGPVHTTRGTQIGYLPQAITDYGDKSLAELIAESLTVLRAAEAEMRQLETRMGSAEGVEQEAILREYAAAAETFERHGGYDIDYRIDTVLAGLRVGHIERDRPFGTLSGGEKARVSLAMLLLRAPDLLLLDEPTNHLDFASMTWLENYLRSYRGAALIVSHDRYFLNRTVNAILEIEEHSRQAKHYTGDYDAYLAAKAIERRRWEEDYVRQQEEIKLLRDAIRSTARQVAHNRPKDNDKFYKGFKDGRINVAISRRVTSAEERLRRIEDDPIPEPPDPLRFTPDFDPAAFQAHLPLTVSGLVKRYGQRTILDNLSFTVGASSRIALVGPNGAGKSTLLRILAGAERPDAGEVMLNPQAQIGYFDQEAESLPPDLTVLDAYRDGLPGNEQQHKAILLYTGLFRYEELDRQVRMLSLGQRRKLQIARLMAEKANLLLLDEPTNYISFDILETLEAALREFPGPILAASHDRRFLEQFGGEVWEVRDGRLIQYMDYAAYLAATK